MSHHDDGNAEQLAARIPADVSRPDKLVLGLTARQLAILAVTVVSTLVIYRVVAPAAPAIITALAVIPVAAAGIALALGRRDGLTLDRYVLAAVEHLRRPRKRVAAPEGMPVPPRWCRLRGRLPAPLGLPVREIRDDGVLDLADGGVAVMVSCSTVPFTLRTPSEQAALVGAFAALLNSLEEPVQILARAQPADLSHLAAAIEDNSVALPHPALETAARAHAAHLATLTCTRELLYRQILLVFRYSPTGGRPGRRPAARDAGAEIVTRRAATADRALAGMGITAQVLDAETATTVLAGCLDPGTESPATPFATSSPVTTEGAPEDSDDTDYLEVPS